MMVPFLDSDLPCDVVSTRWYAENADAHFMDPLDQVARIFKEGIQ